MTQLPTLTPYNGQVPDKNTMDKYQFANAIHPYLNWWNNTVPALQDWTTKLGSLSGEIEDLASSANNSEQKAKDWAEKDTEVENGMYSAKYWANYTENITASLPQGSIDDTTIDTTKTWSSDKINSILKPVFAYAGKIVSNYGYGIAKWRDFNYNKDYFEAVTDDDGDLVDFKIKKRGLYFVRATHRTQRDDYIIITDRGNRRKYERDYPDIGLGMWTHSHGYDNGVFSESIYFGVLLANDYLSAGSGGSNSGACWGNRYCGIFYIIYLGEA